MTPRPLRQFLSFANATTPDAITPAATQQACIGKQHGKEKAKIRILPPIFGKTPQIPAETLGLYTYPGEYIFRVLRAWNNFAARMHLPQSPIRLLARACRACYMDVENVNQPKASLSL
jgi:hypothetical protein